VFLPTAGPSLILFFPSHLKLVISALVFCIRGVCAG
jgi:hypothetical protein